MAVNTPNSLKYTYISHCETLQKFAKIGIFGLKIHHLATLLPAGKNESEIGAINSEAVVDSYLHHLLRRVAAG
jgi:hypothetical protein